MTDWYPIETAPKPPPKEDERALPDNNYHLLGWDGKNMTIIGWNDLSWNEYATSTWYVVHDAENYVWGDYVPTHWTHLPKPPGVSND